MFKSKLLHSLLIAGALAASGTAQAANYVWGFGDLLSATYSPAPTNTTFYSSPFAHLYADDGNGSGTWTFTLQIENQLFASFGSNAYIQKLAMDFTPDPVATPQATFLGSSVTGVTGVQMGNNPGVMGGLTDIDFGSNFGLGAAERLGAGNQTDWVSWSLSGLGGLNYVNQYVKVRGIADSSGGYSNNAYYTPVTYPVPEPETYAMLLAGLGLLGFTARRRKSNSA